MAADSLVGFIQVSSGKSRVRREEDLQVMFQSGGLYGTGEDPPYVVLSPVSSLLHLGSHTSQWDQRGEVSLSCPRQMNFYRKGPQTMGEGGHGARKTAGSPESLSCSLTPTACREVL